MHDDAESAENSTGGTMESSESTTERPEPNEVSMPNPHCVGDALIDDLEQETTLIPSIEGRIGAWYTYNDESDGGEQYPKPNADPFMQTHEHNARGIYAARTYGGGFTMWGAGMGFDIHNIPCEADEDGNPIDENCDPDGMRMPYDIGGYSGIAFFAKSLLGPTDVMFKVPTTLETPLDDGGDCDPDDDSMGKPCEDSYNFMFTAGSEWTLIEVEFEDDLKQGGWGEKFGWDPSAVLGFQWQVPQTEPEFDILIDEICFIE